ncbi:methyltransferase, TIGR04325 family [Bernardetia sp. OM2101]|uniref:methyltransferase, TIGR04325 family n=1 Tax=Bernardetia sp. OM2101 TaxID=3344876 RepID=UPI0035D0D60B
MSSNTKKDKKKIEDENNIRWKGNYNSWQEAQKECVGYDDSIIIQKVLKSTLMVKNEEAVYERDSVLFDKIEYNWSFLATLLKIAINYENKLSIIDFGGALGSTYFQNRHFLNDLKEISWKVVEQEHFVEKGKAYIQNDELSFYYSIEESLKTKDTFILLLSSVIQYLDKPYTWLEKFLSYDFEYIIIDRTAFIENAPERLTIQHTHEPIYEASYPAWFLNQNKFVHTFNKKYELITEFDSGITPSIQLEDERKVYWNGFLFKKIDNI